MHSSNYTTEDGSLTLLSMLDSRGVNNCIAFQRILRVSRRSSGLRLLSSRYDIDHIIAALEYSTITLIEATVSTLEQLDLQLIAIRKYIFLMMGDSGGTRLTLALAIHLCNVARITFIIFMARSMLKNRDTPVARKRGFILRYRTPDYHIQQNYYINNCLATIHE